ncbi:MAG: pantoate--beta-alanine ligase [Gammaproteobacteria bacterium]|nr:pantoate--beta-alanine ligase [Gammaproteobacteria bacterium]MDP2140249.1 pantoate--beta-alanine ligase [Gammaproteobacteria bacterium]MDP2348124.1 pantoate--beta-alanine ligase [Gammaproteobacteria bacterium]
MELIHSITELRQFLQTQRAAGKRIALVPTMGNLHAGHIRLVEEARTHGEVVVCTIFVNPMQFGANEDLDAYPRTLQDDMTKLLKAGCDCVFAPSVAEVYPQGLQHQTVVSVPGISARHCGVSRPGHFDGVATVVSKLFNMVEPDTALFGLKDYQQFMVITKMVTDLCMAVQLVGVETQREASGLALSSRNGYLSADEKLRAATLYRVLQQSAEHLRSGSAIAEVEAQAKAKLQGVGFKSDYFTVCHAQTLEPALNTDIDLVILAAAWMGKTRLIDNLRVQLAD